MNQEGPDDGQPDGAQRLLGLVAEHHDTVRAALDDAQYTLLVGRLTALAEAEPADDRAVARALQGVRLALLPLPLDHPVRRALDSVRLVGAPAGPRAVVAARELADLLAGPPPAPEPGVNGARAELLRTPALSTDQARARCGGTPPPELIRLPAPGDGDRYPDFQFGADGGRPHGVVLEVNRVLLAEIDPWGAASWWLGGNSWLGGTPAALLGRLPDHELLGAATALVEGEA